MNARLGPAIRGSGIHSGFGRCAWLAQRLAILSVVAVFAACGGGTGGGSAPRTPQFVLDPPGSFTNSGSLRLGVDRDSIDANRADRIGIFAEVLDPFREPLRGVTVDMYASFRDVQFLGVPPVPPTRNINPDFPSALLATDADGIAEVTLQAGKTPGRMAVSAYTLPNLNLGGAIFFTLNDVGFIGEGLTVLPSEVTITNPKAGATIDFLVVGGVPFRAPSLPYVLTNEISPVGSGEILFDGKFPAILRYTLTGRFQGAADTSHVVSVNDGNGATATATVTVSFTQILITPSSASLVVGQTQSFALNGGVPPYTCTPAGGTLTPTTIADSGQTTTYTAQEAGDWTIVCADSAGQTASATVTVTEPQPTPTPVISGPNPSATPTTFPATIVVRPNPGSLNGILGGDSTITATVLDQLNQPFAGLTVLFEIVAGQQGSIPQPVTVPFVNPLTAVSDGGGEAKTTLTIPAGTAPQYIDIKGTGPQALGSITGTGTVIVTSQSGGPPGPPARLNAALFRANTFGDNGDGTYITVLSALVTDAEGNPVADGTGVEWSTTTSLGSVVSPAFTNGPPPCNVDQYEATAGVMVLPQPGTALTCLIYPAASIGSPLGVTAKVTGTSITKTTTISLPGPKPSPTPTPPPANTPTPIPTVTAGPPVIAPNTANVTVGGTAVSFAVSSGTPPYTILPNGGTAAPTTLPAAGSFAYTATSPGTFSIIVQDATGKTAQANVTNTLSSILVSNPGPINVNAGDSPVSITITSGGVAPYTILLVSAPGSITGSPVAAAGGSFMYNPPAVGTGSGTILISDSVGNTRVIVVNVS